MKVTVEVRRGIGKETCDDSALVNDQIVNEKSCVFEQEELFNVGVADGVGGNRGGRDASLFVMENLKDCSCRTSGELDADIRELNERLLDHAKTVLGKEEMATTLTFLSASNNSFTLAHVGNTRLYEFNNGYIRKLTNDHTTYQYLLDSGDFVAAENCNKNEIYACLGGGGEGYIKGVSITSDISYLSNCYVMTSDGVHEYLDDDEFEEIFSEFENDADIVKRLIDQAEQKGSVDDKTVMIIRV